MNIVTATGTIVMRGIYVRSVVLAIWCVLLMIAISLVHAQPPHELAGKAAVSVSYLHR